MLQQDKPYDSVPRVQSGSSTNIPDVPPGGARRGMERYEIPYIISFPLQFFVLNMRLRAKVGLG
jgi:hypothetical protein